MTKSTKYRVQTRSKDKFPTIFPRQENASMRFGREAARRDVERQLKRSLVEGTVENDTLGHWIFREPRS